jgi:hypothetical protein
VRVDPAEREFRATSPHEEEEEIEGWMANEEWSDNVHCCETIWSMRTVVFVCIMFAWTQMEKTRNAKGY